MLIILMGPYRMYHIHILIENMYRSKEVIKIINKTYWA